MDSEQTQATPAPEEPTVPAGEEAASGNVPEGGEPDEPIDHRERSRLGRRFTELEGKFASTLEAMSRIEQMLLERERSVPNAEAEDPERFLTVADLDRIQRQRTEAEFDHRRKYERSYIGGIKAQYGKDPDMYAEIEKELLTNVNEYPTHSRYSDPLKDAEINFRLAKAAVIEKRFKESPKPNVKGGTNPPTGFTSSTRTDAPTKPVPKLDEYASKFAAAMGLDDDFVSKSIGRKE